MKRFLDFDESFDSCITATLTLFLSNTTPSSVSLLPNLLALNCRTLNVLSSLICLVDGAGVGDGEGGGGVDCRVFEAEQGSQVQSLFLRYCASGAPVAYSSTGDVSGTYRAWILGSRPWIRMFVARHQQELGTVSTSPAFMRGRPSHSAGPYGRLSQNTVNLAPNTGGWRY